MHIRLNNDVLEMFADIGIKTGKDINTYLKRHLRGKTNEIISNIDSKFDIIINILSEGSHKEIDHIISSIDPNYESIEGEITKTNRNDSIAINIDELKGIIKNIEGDNQLGKIHIRDKWGDKYESFFIVQSKGGLLSSEGWIEFDEWISKEGYPNANIRRDIESGDFIID